MHRRFVWLTLIVGIAVGMVASSAKPAEANGDEDSEVWIRRGIQRRRDGENAAALEAFLRAYRIQPSGRTLAQVGLARQSLRQWGEAADCLEEALRRPEVWVEKNREPLEEALSAVKGHVGWLLVTGPAGARLWLRDIPMGVLPLKEIRLDEGVYAAKVAREGSRTWSQTITVLGQKTREVVVMLEEARPVEPAVALRSPGLDVSTVRSQRSGLGKTIGGGILGAGLAVATVGTVVWIQQAQGSYGTFDSGATGPVLLVGGVVGMLAGGVLLYVSRDTSVSAGMTSSGPVVGGRF
jgi:hypothetical protein